MLEFFISIILVFFVGFEHRPAAGPVEIAPQEFAPFDPAPFEEELAAEPTEPTDPGVPGSFTTAEEVRPILNMTLDHWVALNADAGQDLLYFTHLLSWRCGLSEIRYGLNGAPPTEVLEMEPCHIGTNSPNAITDMSYPLFLVLPPGGLQSIEVEVVFDDGTVSGVQFLRERILMP